MMKDRYEQEIEQLLRDLDTKPPGDAPEQPSARRGATPPDDEPSPFAPKLPTRKRVISPAKLSLIGIAIALVGLLLPGFWLPLAGLAMVVVAIAWMFLQRATTPNRAVWRGRPADPPPQTPWQRFRHWLSQ